VGAAWRSLVQFRDVEVDQMSGNGKKLRFTSAGRSNLCGDNGEVKHVMCERRNEMLETLKDKVK